MALHPVLTGQLKAETEEAHEVAVAQAEKYDEYEGEIMAADDDATKWALYEPYLKVRCAAGRVLGFVLRN